MEKKNIDWANLGFNYVKTDYRFVSNFKNGAWDEGALITDDTVTISECAGVLQYAQTVFEGLKAYTTEDGHIVTFSSGSECRTHGKFRASSGNARISRRAFH